MGKILQHFPKINVKQVREIFYYRQRPTIVEINGIMIIKIIMTSVSPLRNVVVFSIKFPFQNIPFDFIRPGNLFEKFTSK